MSVELPTELGPYRVLREVGAGGMGNVVLVEDRRGGDLRAMKWVLRQPGADPGSAARRHRREYRLLSAIDHPTILPVFDFGQVGRVQYFTAEYLAGPELEPSQFLQASPGPWLPAVLNALEFLHQRGWVHGDLKPQHVIFSDETRTECRLVDFGLSKAVDEPLDSSVMGTVHYMPPERFRGKSFGTASDLYSIGVMLYELIAGRLPFQADRKLEVIEEILEGRFESLRDCRPDASPQLTSVVESLLSRDPAKRPQSIEAVRSVLQQVWQDADWAEDEAELRAYVVSDPVPSGQVPSGQVHSDPLQHPLEQVGEWRHPVMLLGAKKAVDLIVARRRLLPALRLAGRRDVEVPIGGFTFTDFARSLADQDPRLTAVLREAIAVDELRNRGDQAPTPGAWDAILDRGLAPLLSSIPGGDLHDGEGRFAILLDARALENPWLASLVDACANRPSLGLMWVILDHWGNPRSDVVEHLAGWETAGHLRIVSLSESDPVSRETWFTERFGSPGLPESVELLLAGESRASEGRLELLLRGLLEAGVVGRQQGRWCSFGPHGWKRAPEVPDDHELLVATAAVEGSDAADLRSLCAAIGRPLPEVVERLSRLSKAGWVESDSLSGAVLLRSAMLRKHLLQTVPATEWEALHRRAARWILSTDYAQSPQNWERLVHHQSAAGEIDELWERRLEAQPGRQLADRPATAHAWLERCGAWSRGPSDARWLAECLERLRYEVGPVARVVTDDGLGSDELTARRALLAAANEPVRDRAQALISAIRPLDRRDPLRHESLLSLLEILAAEGQPAPPELWLELEQLREHAGPRSLALEFELRMGESIRNGEPAAARVHGRAGIETLEKRSGARARAWGAYLRGRLDESRGDLRQACTAYATAIQEFRPVGEYRGLLRALLRWLTAAASVDQLISPGVWRETELWVNRLGGAAERRWWSTLSSLVADPPSSAQLSTQHPGVETPA